MKFLKGIFIEPRFFYMLGAVAVMFALSYAIPVFMVIAFIALIILNATTLVEIFFLFKKRNPLAATRKLGRILSLGDENSIEITLENSYPHEIRLMIIDELPVQLQERKFSQLAIIQAVDSITISYLVRPVVRGEYHFGNINLFAFTIIHLVSRRVVVECTEICMVFPSIIQMKKYELKSMSSLMRFSGIKKVRKIGHSYEYEQIRDYVTGDDNRSLNWKASSRSSNLKVNQYEDERSQQIYCLIDKSRSMKMPFNGLSLLDYSINTSLVISNVALKKYDRAGLISFSDKIGSLVAADNKKTQLNSILSALYNEKENLLEADYELMYSAVRSFVKVRSLFFLFTNFQSLNSLERVLPILRKLNKVHLLVVMFFENSEVMAVSENPGLDLDSIYSSTLAKKMITEKQLIYQELRKHGIQAIVSKPENLSINTVNKYLEMKAMGLI